MDLYRYRFQIVIGCSVLPILVVIGIAIAAFGFEVNITNNLILFLVFFTKSIALMSIYYFLWVSAPYDSSIKRLSIVSLVFYVVSAIYGFNIINFANNLPAIASIAFVSFLLGIIVLFQTMSIRLNGMYSGEISNNLVAIASLNLVFETPLVIVLLVLGSGFFTGNLFLYVIVGVLIIYWIARIYLNYVVCNTTDLMFARNRKKMDSTKLSENIVNYSNKFTE